MRAPSPDALRTRLEDSAELLEATRVRYRALRLMLRGFLWKDRLRRNGELLRQVAQAQPEVEEALARAVGRAEAEGWSREAPLTRCLREVEELREELLELSARRLRREGAGQ